MSFFAQRWGVRRGLGDNIPPTPETKPAPETNPTPEATPDTAVKSAEYFYNQTGLSAKNFDADDRKKANELNEKFDAFKIPRYAICSPRGGISYRAIGESCNDKENIRYTSEKVLSRYLDNNYGVGIDTFKSNTITELRSKIKPKEKKDKPEPKAKSEPKEKKDKPEPKAKSEPKAKFSSGDFVWKSSEPKRLGEEYKVVSSSFDKNRKEFIYVLRGNRGVRKETDSIWESLLEKTDGKEILDNDKSDDWLDTKKSKPKSDCPPVPRPKAATPVVAKPKPEPKTDSSGDGKKEELNKKIDNLTELLNRAVKKPAA